MSRVRRVGVRRSRPVIVMAVVAVAVMGGRPLVAQQGAPDFDALGTEALAALRQYIRIDTSNPPGDVTKAADFVQKLLEAEGIPVTRYEPAPGRSIVLYAFIALKRQGVPLDRDVLLMASPDEEIGGGSGAVWMREHHYEDLDPEYILDGSDGSEGFDRFGVRRVLLRGSGSLFRAPSAESRAPSAGTGVTTDQRSTREVALRGRGGGA